MTYSANTELTDAFIRHQIYLNRYSGHLTKEIRKELDATIDLVEKEIEKLTMKSLRTKRKTVLSTIQKLRLITWNKSWKKYIREIKKFSKGEAQHIKKIITEYAPVHLVLNIPGQDSLKKIIRANINNNQTRATDIDYWMKSTTDADLKKIRRITRFGVAGGLPTKEISSMLKAQNLVAEKHAQAVSRTFVKHISSSIRKEIAVSNQDIFENERFVATLDSRTTLICANKDGDIYPVGEGPELPLHFACRSELVPTLNGERLGDRPAKNSSEKLALKSYARKHNIRDYREVKKTKKVKKYIRDFINERTGPVPAKTTYEQWFSKQSSALQNEILGPKRAEIYRTSGLKLNKFIDKSGKTLTLAELGEKYDVGLVSDSY